MVFLSAGSVNAATFTLVGTIELTAEKVNVQRERGPAKTYLKQGNAELARGEFDQAILDYNRAIELNPQYALAYCNRGNAKTAKGDSDGGIADYNCAIQVNPQLAIAYNNRSSALREKKDLTAALNDCNRAIAIDPETG
jgi:tetratricopeptide (TPR) repeat protein